MLRLQNVEVPEDQAVAASPLGSAAARPSRNMCFLVAFASVCSRDGTYTPRASRGPVAVSTVTVATRCGRWSNG
ncbi:hypothetical protein AB0I68_16945 [Streptomyces sp. NPDC050448]|uniref:hypothetical protein n=1 Tax=Streptomyces sp. NPDC050448 TaxID=3155404 RepID=UPI003448A3B4